MVHGICSSAGCYSMTDAQIAEIYAIAREAFNCGQAAIQMESFPFRMTAENLAKHRLDPNIAFWKEIKNGADHFELTKTEPEVLVCGKHYVFGAHSDHDLDASAPCPANLQRDDQVEAAVAEKEANDDAAVVALVAQGVKPIRIVYQDGGQNAAFAGREDLDPSAPEALAAGPTVITLDNSGKPLPPAVKVASAADVPAPTAAPAAASAPAAAPAQAAANTTNASPFGFLNGGGVKSFFGLGGGEAQQPQIKVFEPAQPIPTDAPLPPKRSAALDARGPQAMADSPLRAQ